MKINRFVVFTLLAAPLLGAESTSLRLRSRAVVDGGMHMPTIGLLANAEGNTITEVQGVLGAISVSEEVALVSAEVRIAPRQEWILLKRLQGYVAYDWIRSREINLPIQGADKVAFGPSGNDLAAVWYADRRLVVLSGLPEAPTVIRDEHRGEISELMRALSTNDGGRVVVAVSAEGRMWKMPVEQSSTEIYQGGDIPSLAFVPEGTALVFADTSENSVFSIDTGSYGAVARVLLSGTDGLDRPDAVWAGSQGRLAVLSEKRGTLWCFDVALGKWTLEDVPAAISIEETQIRDTLLLKRTVGEAPLLYRWGSGEQHLFVVPQSTSDVSVGGEQ